MAKLTDAQVATLTRGAQQASGLISPAPKTPAHMAIQQAEKMATAGLVQRIECYGDEPWYDRDEGAGEFYGYRLTAAGFEALGIDASEWPAYANAEADAPAPVADMPKAWEAPGPSEQDLDVADAAAERAAYREEQESELADEEAADPFTGAPDEMAAKVASGAAADKTLVTVDASYLGGDSPFTQPRPPIRAANEFIPYDTSAAPDVPKASLRDAAAAFLAAWDACPSQDATDNSISRAVEALRAAMPAAKAPKAPKVAGEPGEPREGSKAALVIGLLQRPGGATAAQVEEATGWTNTSARGFISSLKIKRGLAVETAKIAKVTHYWIGAENAPEVEIDTTKPAPGTKAGEQPAF